MAPGLFLRRVADQQWNVESCIVKGIFAPEPIIAKKFAVIRGQNDDRIVKLAARLKPADNPPDVIINFGRKTKIQRTKQRSIFVGLRKIGEPFDVS